MRLAVACLLLCSVPAGAVSGSRAEGERKLAEAAAEYDMAIEIAGGGTKADRGVSCAAMSATHVTLALPLFVPELRRYPRDFFSSVGISRMVLCGDLTWDGKRVGGLAVGGSRTFYLNLKSANVSPGHAASSLHHEVFHLIDRVDEREWARTSGGFVSDYARTSPREDRAELFAQLMVNRRSVTSRASGNRALAEKVERLDGWVADAHPALATTLRGR